MSLTEQERERFERGGYLMCPGAVPGPTVDALTKRLSILIERCAREHQSGARRTMDFWRTLRASRDDAAVFWDTSRGPMPEDPRAWESRAMRVGHGLHLRDELFADVCRRGVIGNALSSLGAQPMALLQSAVVYKQPHSELVQFGLHQDAAYLTTEPESLVLAFLALDDMDAENGALAVVPGSHREGRHLTLTLDESGYVPVEGRDVDSRRYQATPLAMTRGTVALLHGRTLHGSGPNNAPRPRRALIVHAFSLRSMLSPHSWVQAPPDGFVTLGPVSSST